jgi:hypothetical protein
MLVKRDDRLSGLFDPYSDADGGSSPWPEEDPPFDVSDESGSRPMPGAQEGAKEEEANSGGVATPRFWSIKVPASSTPLPVVTAKAEPTQRGLGIPPPPSVEEMAWFERMPSLTSVTPLSPDAFDREAAPTSPTGRDGFPSSLEPTENDRITVRAPATAGKTESARRRRGYAIALVALLGVVVGLLNRRRVVSNEHAAAPEPATTVVPAAVEAPARADNRPNDAVSAAQSGAAVAEPLPSTSRADNRPNDAVSADESGIAVAEARPSTSRIDSRHERRHREHRAPNTDAAPARAPAPDVASGLDPAPASREPPSQRTLSLPPR